MSPRLENIVVNGASRHRIRKGILIRRNDAKAVDSKLRDTIVRRTAQSLAGNTYLQHFTLEESSTHPSLVYLRTPFLPVYSVNQRNVFMQRLSSATKMLIQVAAEQKCHIIAAGVNPLDKDADEQSMILCADFHEIEVFDEEEVERIYNLYRQFLPELLAISTHAAVYNGVAQKDRSFRMRKNNASFLPHYLSQFNAKNLAQLERMMRRDHGLSDLRLMDVNPLGGNAQLLLQSDLPLLRKNAASVELRFIDAQCSCAFIRAQIVLLQAIAMYGRSLTRRGKRLPFMRDKVINENRSLALQGGAEAMLQPDDKFTRDDGRKGYSYHDKGKPEVATTALLMIINGLLLPGLQDLGCQFWELQPILLGAELRVRNLLCFANYSEYQQYLCKVHKQSLAQILHQQTDQLLSTSLFDIISDYNRQMHGAAAQEIEAAWEKKLTIRAGQRHNHHDAGSRQKRDQPKDVRTTQQPVMQGIISALDQENSGTIKDRNGAEFHFSAASITDGAQLYVHDHVSFIVQSKGASTALRVRLESRKQGRGLITWFDALRCYGIIKQDNGKEAYFHLNDVEGNVAPQEGLNVSFQIIKVPDQDVIHPVHIRIVKGK